MVSQGHEETTAMSGRFNSLQAHVRTNNDWLFISTVSLIVFTWLFLTRVIFKVFEIVWVYLELYTIFLTLLNDKKFFYVQSRK